MKYDFWKGFRKAVISVVLVMGTVVLDILPVEWANITLGGALVLGLNFLKVKYLR